MIKFLNTFLLGLVIALIIPSVVLLFSAIHKNQKMEEQLSELQNKLTKQKTELMELTSRLNDFKFDSNRIEKVAREKFNLCKEEETIYKFDKKSGSYNINTREDQF